MSADDLLADVTAKARDGSVISCIKEMAAAQMMGTIYASRLAGLSRKQWWHIFKVMWKDSIECNTVLGLQNATLQMAKATAKLQRMKEARRETTATD